MEYIGGSRAPGAVRFADDVLTVSASEIDAVGVVEVPVLPAAFFASPGSDNVIGASADSGINEEAEERSERTLLVRPADFTEGSELADDTDGESRTMSGDVA